MTHYFDLTFYFDYGTLMGHYLPICLQQNWYQSSGKPPKETQNQKLSAKDIVSKEDYHPKMQIDHRCHSNNV
jgi:hypothetical protein